MRTGRAIPLPPVSLRPEAKTFVESLSRAAESAEHSSEHARAMRQSLHGLSYFEGTGTYWLTISPQVDLNIRIYLLSGSPMIPPPDNPLLAPIVDLRFAGISAFPAGSALFFEQVCFIVFRHIQFPELCETFLHCDM